MSPNTKQVLAILLGALGLAMGVLGTVTAYNAKNATDTDGEVAAQVQQRFDEAQARQDELEKTQASDAERLVESLTTGEKSLLKRIHANTASIKRLRRQSRQLRGRVDSLTNRDRELSGEVSSLENDFNEQVRQLNRRINRTNGRLNRQEGQIQRLRGRAGP